MTGPPATGLEGFRRSHLAALEAPRLSGSWLCDYASVAVPSPMTINAQHAGWFAADMLGPLAGNDQRRALLQDTLLVYLASGRSRVAAAAALHVLPGTVAYRVRQAETLLGRPVDGIDRDFTSTLGILRASRA